MTGYLWRVRLPVLALCAGLVLFAPAAHEHPLLVRGGLREIPLGVDRLSGTDRPNRMPPSCQDIRQELKFGFKLLVHGFPHHPVDIVEGKVTVVVGPALFGQESCAPQSFHVRMSLQYRHLGAWKPIASAKIDENAPVAGTTVTASASRQCEEAWNGLRHWRLMMHYWGRNGVGTFQRGQTAFWPGRGGRGMRCLSA